APCHPRLVGDRSQPVGGCRNPPQVLADVLLADPANEDIAPGRDLDRRAEYLLAEEDPLGVVAQRPVLPGSQKRLARIEPVVYRLVVRGDSTPAPRATVRVVVGMRHR